MTNRGVPLIIAFPTSKKEVGHPVVTFCQRTIATICAVGPCQEGVFVISALSAVRFPAQSASMSSIRRSGQRGSSTVHNLVPHSQHQDQPDATTPPCGFKTRFVTQQPLEFRTIEQLREQASP